MTPTPTQARPSMDMIERIARAINPKAWEPANWYNDGEDEAARQTAYRRARAAVEAMREPDADMLQAGQAEGAAHVRAHYVLGFPAHPVAEFKVGGEEAIWQSMINAILAHNTSEDAE